MVSYLENFLPHLLLENLILLFEYIRFIFPSSTSSSRWASSLLSFRGRISAHRERMNSGPGRPWRTTWREGESNRNCTWQQCDKMAKLSLQYCSYNNNENLQISPKCAQLGSKFCPIQNKPSNNSQRL